MLAVAMSRAEFPYTPPTPSPEQFPVARTTITTTTTVTSSQATKEKRKFVDELFSNTQSDDIIESTPRFAESTLSKKYKSNKPTQRFEVWKDIPSSPRIKSAPVSPIRHKEVTKYILYNSKQITY